MEDIPTVITDKYCASVLPPSLFAFCSAAFCRHRISYSAISLAFKLFRLYSGKPFFPPVKQTIDRITFYNTSKFESSRVCTSPSFVNKIDLGKIVGLQSGNSKVKTDKICYLFSAPSGGLITAINI